MTPFSSSLIFLISIAVITSPAHAQQRIGNSVAVVAEISKISVHVLWRQLITLPKSQGNEEFGRDKFSLKVSFAYLITRGCFSAP